jgi:hypothetical protein
MTTAIRIAFMSNRGVRGPFIDGALAAVLLHVIQIFFHNRFRFL